MSLGVKHRVGLVGAGYISEFHIAALRRTPDAELVGIFDLDAGRAETTATRFGVRTFPSLAAICQAGATSVHVLTPPSSHAAVAIEALNLGCHVLVEKPLAEDVADCERIQKVADENGRKVCVNHSLLFDPQVRRAIEVARSGKLGRIISVDILRSSSYPPFDAGPLPPQYRSAGYPFRDLGVHALYLFQAFLGPIEDVEATWQSLGGDPNLAFDEWRALVCCRDGLGQFQLSWNVKPLQNRIIIQGTKGVLGVDLFLMFQSRRGALSLPKPAERIINAYTESLRPIVEVPWSVAKFIAKRVLPYHGLQALVREFYRTLDASEEVPVPVRDAIPVVDWVERVARRADEEYHRATERFTLSGNGAVLVTGASGAVGKAVVDRLRSENIQVRIFVRRPPKEVLPGLEVALGDLGDPAAVDRAVQGTRQVIHAGAAMKGGWPEHLRATVQGTQNVIDSCLKHGVEKLIHISSMSVNHWAGAKAGEVIDEATPLEPRAADRGAYTRAKLEAEQTIVGAAKGRGLPAVVLRPGQIFGGGIPLMTPAVARRALGRWLVLGNGRVNLPLIHMDDVVDAIRLAMDGPLKAGEIIQIVDPVTLTQNDVLAGVGDGKLKVLRVPRWLVYSLGKCSEIGLGLLGRKSPLSVYRLKSALAVRTFHSRNAETLLGWRPARGVHDGIREFQQVTAVSPV